MKKKSGHRRRTKVVRRSRKNLRRTVKRKSLAKGRRRPTRRYSRVQRGGGLTDDDSKCLITVGKMLEKGELKINNVDKDNILLPLYQKAAVKQYPPACFAYGQYMEKNNFTDAAIYNYDIAAQKGHTDALYNLGKMYENGKGVARDYAKAADYYERAAHDGNADVQYKLGYMFEYAQGDARDYAKAIRYYELAAAQGHTGAKFQLGTMFEYGKGVTQDDAEAIRYYELAAEQGHEGARGRMNDLKKIIKQ